MTPEPAPPQREDDLLNEDEAAALLDVTTDTLRRRRETGQIRAVRAGGGWRRRWMYRRGDLIDYLHRVLTAREPNPPPPPDTLFPPTPAQQGAVPPPPPPPPPQPPRTHMEEMNALITEIAQGMKHPPDADPPQLADQSPAVRMANAIIVQAIEAGASDIHIEPDSRRLRVRYRIDGVIEEVMTIPKLIQDPLLTRYAVMADLNPEAEATPQVGRIPILWHNNDYDLRVSSLRGIYGDTIVARIAKSPPGGFNTLGMNPMEQAVMEDRMLQPSGLILLAGPPGAGTTTTLRNLLHRINSLEKNIVVLQEPVEITLGGVAHVPVQSERGLTLTQAARSAALQDADIIAFGDLRDAEWAACALEAAENGCLVPAAMHANDAVSAYLRLIDWGLAPGRLHRVGACVLAQRLVRTICPDCKEEYPATPGDLNYLRRVVPRFAKVDVPLPDQPTPLYRGRGCDACRGKGYRGRTGLFEFLPINAEMAELVARRASLSDLRDAAMAAGLRPLKGQAAEKVLSGETTLEEMARVFYAPWLE